MDPTKSFDHLDPKLKDTYARVMGTTPDNTASNASVPAPTDPSLSATPPPPAEQPTQPFAGPVQSPFNANPLDQAFNSGGNPNPPNPGTGPTVNTMPAEASTMFASATPAEQAVDPTAPTTSSFFSNPSPATADPSQLGDQGTVSIPVDPAAAQIPITPYSSENIAGVQPSVPNGQFTQPLPSPSSVAHSGTHETSALLKVLYIVAAVVFFAVYTIFWIKVFNLPFIF
jgi:hypothetical protein